jgi:hypothetical protein
MGIEISNLNQCIDEIDKIEDSDWIQSLVDRKKKELQFHDQDRDRERVIESKANDTYEKFYGNKKGEFNYEVQL